jgi:hypothetical protein
MLHFARIFNKCFYFCLQGKIQTLKKTATKGDKKKKKEVTDEIAKLETELNQKHDQELEDFEKTQKNEENPDSSNNAVSKTVILLGKLLLEGGSTSNSELNPNLSSESELER